MDDDAEVLDWGNEDDEAQVAVAYQESGQDDAEDAISLGGDEDDEIYPYKTLSHEDLSKAQQAFPRSSQTPQQGNSGKRDLQRENSDTLQKPLSQATDSSQLQRSQSLTQKVHGLPAKPIGAPTSPLPAPATTSTLASTMAVRERRLNAPSKNVSSSRDRGTGLPPDWEERLPRNGGDNPYFYNVKTHQSTWTRPPFADLGSPSPGKGRDYDGVHGIVDRSPRRGVVDDVARPPLTEVRRRTSPGGSLTFDDRHYRPGASGAVNLQPTLVDKHATQTASPRSFQRLPSPRGSDRRRETRPVTPPPPRRPRSAERPGRTQRAPSLPPADRLPSRRDTGDVRRSPIQDRAWDRTRVTSGRDDMRGQDFTVESTAHRGRRPRDDALPDRMRNNQEPRASRPRSPPSHLHDPSPQRRYVEHGSSGRDSRQKGQHDRQSTPPPQRLRGNDPYTATDLVPQRRTRDYDPEYESEIKRRRIDEDSYKRRSSVERASYSPLLDRQPLSADAGKKRPPLPPQSEHFREISRGQPGADVPLPHQPSHPSSRQTDSYAGSRSGAQYSDGPSATREHYTSSTREPDTRYTSHRSRYEEIRTDDTMDVDYPSQTSRSGSSRGEFPPSRPRGNDRPTLGLQMDTLPKGPRAMSRTHGSLSHTPPSPSPVLPSVPIRMPEPASSNGRLPRVHPPHLRQDTIPVTRTSGPPSGPRVHGDHSEPERRPSRFQDAPNTRDAPPVRSSRWGDAVPPEPKGSGTNNIPIGGAKRLTPPVLSAHSPVTERIPARHIPEPMRAPSLHSSYVQEDNSAYDTRPIQGRGRRESVSGHGGPAAMPHSPRFDMPPPTTVRGSAREEVPSNPAPRPERQTRFGPPDPANEPRIWLTREESLSRGAIPDHLPTRGTRGFDSGRNEPATRYDVSDRRRGNDDTHHRRTHYVEPPPTQERSMNGADDRSSRGRPQSLDRRTINDHRSPPYEQPANVRDVPDARPRDHNQSSSFPEHSWRESSSSSRVDADHRRNPPVHIDRTRGLGLMPPPSNGPPLGVMSTLARDQRDLTPEFRETPSYDGSSYVEDIDVDDGAQGPPVRRGASLLDRLSLSDPPAPPPPSLTDRLQDPPKRTLPQVSGLPPRPSAETTLDAEMHAALEFSGRGRGRKRKVRGVRRF